MVAFCIGLCIISRIIPNNNKRQKKLYLTAEGKKLIELVQQIFFDLETVITSSISEPDKQNVRNILKNIIRNFNNSLYQNTAS